MKEVSLSSIDTDTEQKMQAVMHDHFKDCTVVAVAHRLKTVVDFDRVLVLDQGRIVECDTPTALLSRPSLFRTMYDLSEAIQDSIPAGGE